MYIIHCNTKKHNAIFVFVLQCNIQLYGVMFMGIEKKTYSFRLGEDLVESLRFYAQQQNRTLSNFVETTLMEKLDTLEKEAAGKE